MRTLFARIGIEVRERPRACYLTCPFHDDKHPSAWITPGDDYFECFSCGAKGDVIWIVRTVFGMGFGEACEWLRAQFGIPDDPYEEMYLSVTRALVPKKRESAGDVRQAFLEMEHARYWQLVDAHPECAERLRDAQQRLLVGFKPGKAREWYREALETLEGIL